MILHGLLQVIAQEANRLKIDVDELFNVTLYTSAADARTVTNGIDLATHGGLVWERYRTADHFHAFIDSERGLTEYILPQSVSIGGTDTNYMDTFNSDGYSLLYDYVDNTPVVSNTFRIAPRFLDIVTYTGNGVDRDIAHGLGIAPGFILIKARTAATAWASYHRSVGAGSALELKNSGALYTESDLFDDTEPSASVFRIGTDARVNADGEDFVAYVFAHDPSGVIQCGSYTGNGSTSGPTVTLGWEPQWLLIKRTDGDGDWNVIDSTRGLAVGSDNSVALNTMAAEVSADVVDPISTGFTLKTTDAAFNANGGSYVYLAIRA